LPAQRRNDCLAALQDSATDPLLKRVSRSFHLSLQLLPRPMRGSASLAYLLARASDTLADSTTAPPALRLDCLRRFSENLRGTQPAPWPDTILLGVRDPAEKQLLMETPSLLETLWNIPAAEADLIREVVGIIIGGQRLDLERFGEASAECPVSLPDDAALDDYTWRVAGCVGEFWTRLGLLTLGSAFSEKPADALVAQGIRYGRGLQLVNILRDLPADLAQGRCYLPLSDPADTHRLLEEHTRWLETARGHVTEGFNYASALPIRRLRAASVLPAMIARDTLDLLAAAGPAVLRGRIKVPRRAVYRSLLRAFFMRSGS
jgi:farnesyl-diphosphate farnesyltransferase